MRLNNHTVFITGLLLIIGAGNTGIAQDTLEISTAIKIGLENNYDIKISEGVKEIASNNNTIGNAGFLPTLDATGSRRFTVENTNQTFVTGQEQERAGAKSNNWSGAVTLNWTIFDGTTMFFNKGRLEELELQGVAMNKFVIQDIVARIAKEFYTVALEQFRLELMKENIQLSEERIQIARNKYEFGKASKMEYLQAQVDLNRDKSNLMIQQENLAAAKTTLNELLARDVTHDFYVEFDPDLNLSLQYEELKAEMEAGNPELRASRYQVNASQLVQKELTGERMPRFGLNLGYNYAKSEAEAGFLLNRQSSGITYGVSASWNIFNGFNLNRRIQNARITAENSQLNYEAQKLNLEKELYSIFINYRNNIQLRQLEGENRAVAEENNEIARERYRVGNSSPLELREAQINLLEANLRYLNAIYSIKTAEIDLLSLSGQLID